VEDVTWYNSHQVAEIIANEGQICICSCYTIFSKDINMHHVDQTHRWMASWCCRGSAGFRY